VREVDVNQKPTLGLICCRSMAIATSDEAWSAFETSVRRETRVLFSVAVAILRDPHEAEDAVQDTLEIAWRSRGSLREGEKQGAWLRQICIRRCLRVKHRLLKRLFLAERSAVEAKPLDTIDSDLDRACRRLTLHQRAVIALHYHYGYSLDECATLMNCRPGTVRSHLARALTALRKQLGGDGSGDV
jgi:RNA polymerase sigma-70 factor, ECF subfamily